MLHLDLEIGDLVVDVKKLNKDSSFMVESQLGVAGIRGTQFGMSVDSKSTELAVLEGKVGFKDANQTKRECGNCSEGCFRNRILNLFLSHLIK